MELLLMDVSSVRQQPEPAPVERVVRPDRPLHDRQLDSPATSAPHVVGRRAHGVRGRHGHAVHVAERGFFFNIAEHADGDRRGPAST